MSPPPPAIHLVSKTDFTKQHILPLLTTTTTTTNSSQEPTTLLPTRNTVLIRSRTLALTTNNFSYARLGGLPFLGWWDVFPVPDSSVLPTDARETIADYARISAWGYAEVVESTTPGLPVGERLFGYLPIGTALERLELVSGEGEGEGVKGLWVEKSERRRGLNGVYNRYYVPGGVDAGKGGKGGERDRDSQGWDALLGLLWQTGYLLNRVVFSPGGEGALPPVHPTGGKEATWTAEDADLTGAVVVLLAASGKTALGFAHELRFARPEGKKPAKVIAVGSARSREFVRGTGLFDEVLLYEDVGETSVDLVAKLGGQRLKKVVLADFGARGSAADEWAKALEDKTDQFQALVVGSDPLAKERSGLAQRAADPNSGVAQMLSGVVRDRAVDAVGAAKYFAGQDAAWENFKATGGIRGLNLKWRAGLEAFSKDWDALVRGEYGPETGLVYEL